MIGNDRIRIQVALNTALATAGATPIVKGSFSGRLIQHLGFFKGATQGLQLFHWTKGLSLELKVNVLEFETTMADVMPIIEYAFAKRLQPLIGKHK